MKFSYIDESGDKPQGDVFVMAGVQVDAYKLRKHTAKFDKMIAEFLAKHPGAPKELKTKALLNGDGGWRQVKAEDRKPRNRYLMPIVQPNRGSKMGWPSTFEDIQERREEAAYFRRAAGVVRGFCHSGSLHTENSLGRTGLAGHLDR